MNSSLSPQRGFRQVSSASFLPLLFALISWLAVSLPAVGQELLKVSILQSSASLPASTARLANELGLFKKHGLDATIGAAETGSVAMSALVSGSVQFITSGSSDSILAFGRGQRAVTLTTTYHGFSAVLVLSKTAVEKIGVSASAPVEQRLKALDGLTIASTSASSPFTIAVKASAAAVGANIKLVYMAQPAMVAALKTGVVDGISVAAPFYAQPPREGFGTIWISGPKGEFLVSPANSTMLIAMRNFASSNPELVRRTVAVFRDLGRIVVEQPDLVKKAIAKMNPDLDAATMDLVFETDSRGFAVGELTTRELEQDIQFMKNSGLSLPGVETITPADLMLK
mgnify:CR=1 FL=1